MLGFDLALDRTGELFLLEVNSGPDLSLHGARLAADLDRLLSEVLSVTNRHLYRGEPAQGAAAALRPLLNTDIDASAACAAPAEIGDAMGGFTCVVSRRCDAPSELARFKRSMATVGKFAHAMHETAGAPVRGVQGVVAKAGGSKAPVAIT